MLNQVAVLTYKMTQLSAQFGAGFVDVYQTKALTAGRMDEPTFRAMAARRCRICKGPSARTSTAPPTAAHAHAPCAGPGFAFAHNKCINKYVVAIEEEAARGTRTARRGGR